jgi:hypothetical protein
MISSKLQVGYLSKPYSEEFSAISFSGYASIARLIILSKEYKLVPVREINWFGKVPVGWRSLDTEWV